MINEEITIPKPDESFFAPLGAYEIPRPISDPELVQQQIEKLLIDIQGAADLIQEFEESRQIALMLPSTVLGDPTLQSIPDEITNVRQNVSKLVYENPGQIESNSQLKTALQQLKEPQLDEVERQSIAFLRDLAGNMDALAFASEHGSPAEHANRLEEYRALWKEAVAQFTDHEGIVDQMQQVLTNRDTSYGTLEVIMNYNKPKRDAFESRCKDSIAANSLEHVRPADGEIVLLHRTGGSPDIFFDTGLGFSINILSTATVHYQSTDDESLVDHLFKPHKFSNIVIVCMLPEEALIRNIDESDLNSQHASNIADDYLSKDSGRFEHMIDRRYIKGAVNRITGEFVPNPHFMEEHEE